MGAYIITGASSGIGKEVFELLNKKNIPCVLVGRNLKKLKNQKCENTKINHVYYQLDLERPNTIIEFFEFLKKQKINVSGLIYCAGANAKNNLCDEQISNIEKIYNVNVFSFFEMTKQLFKYPFREKDTRIVALSSIASIRPLSMQIGYSSSKTAMNSMVKSLAQEGIKFDIKVNAVLLGAINTPMLNTIGVSQEDIEKLNRHYPLGVLEPDIVAKIIYDLLSEHFKYMTGSLIKIDSGFEMVH